MSFKAMALIVLFPAVLAAGCSGKDKPREEASPATSPANGVATRPDGGQALAPTSAKSEPEVLRGLQSLPRVQIWMTGATEAQQADVAKLLRDQLPQLDTAGSSDDWAIEFVCSAVVVPADMPGAVGSPKMPTCCCRVLKPAVVDGRLATAVAYEGPLLVGEAVRGMNGGGSSRDPDGKGLLVKAIGTFADAWRQAKPGAERKE